MQSGNCSAAGVCLLVGEVCPEARADSLVGRIGAGLLVGRAESQGL